MATEFNYVARLDTTQIMAGLAEIRSQIGMAFGAPTGFSAPASAIQGGGFAGFSGQSNVQAGLSSQFQQMFAGMRGAGNMFGGTFTNPAMAYSPHYGMAQAQSSLDQEWFIHRYGMGAAQAMKPPGMSAAEYALGMEGNFLDRQINARHAANMAAQSSFYAGVGGIAAGEAAATMAAPLGAMAGRSLATRFFGAGAAGAGGMIGGLAAGWMAFDMASDYVGGKVQQHYAEIEQIQGVTRELGELAGGGRGLKRTQRVELGIAAREAASDLKMDVQEMGDILALGRQSGMLPTSTDPGKAREQFRDFARSIEEGAQILHTSLANATQVIKSAVSSGQTAQEGIVRAAAYGGAEHYLQIQGFGNMGAQVGRAMGFTGPQGSGVFMSALGAAGSAGLSYEEMRIMGGRYAAAQFIGSTQMGMATSPLGNAQLMASMGGQNLGGMGMMDLAGAALTGLGAGGGDMMSNMGRFLVHQNEYRRGIGAGGIRTMARQQIQMGGDLINEFMPDLSVNEAQRMYAMSMGMNPDQAKLFVGGMGHRSSGIGGGVGALGQMRAIEAMQDTMVSGNFVAPHISKPAEFGWGHAKEGAMIGGSIGMMLGPKGAVAGALIGGAIGFVEGNLGAFKEAFSGEGPGLFASARDKADYYERKMAAEYEARMLEARQRIGAVSIDKAAGMRFLRGDVSHARLNFDLAGSSVASSMTAATLQAMGLQPVMAGPGTMQISGQYFSNRDIQSMARGKLWDKPYTEADEYRVMEAAYSAGYGGDIDVERLRSDVGAFRQSYDYLKTGRGGYLLGNIQMDKAGASLLPLARGFVEAITDSGATGKVRARLLQKLDSPGGFNDPEVRAYLKRMTGVDVEGLPGAFMAARAGAVGTAATVDATASAEANYLLAAYGGGPASPTAIDKTVDATNAEAETDWATSGIRELGRWRRGRGRETGAAYNLGDLGGAVMNERMLRERYQQTDTTTVARGVRESFFSRLRESEFYAKARSASLGGDDDLARKLMHQAKVDVLTAGGEMFRGYDPADIDPSQMTYRPGAVEMEKTRQQGRVQFFQAAVAMGFDAAPLLKLDAVMSRHVLDKTSLKEQWKIENKALGDLKPKRKRKTGPGTLQRAVGFGQQESAMSSIQRSLQHTERTLRALEKRISSMPTPQGSSDGQTTTGGR